MKRLFLFFAVLGISCPTFAQNGRSNPPGFWHEAKIIRRDSAPLTTVKNFVGAYQKGDLKKINALVDNHIVWTEPGENRISGKKTSRPEVLRMLNDMKEFSAGTIRIAEIRYFDAGGNNIGCLIHWRAAQPPGRVLDVSNIGIFTVENRKILMVKIFSDNVAAENSFWGKE
jgi:limonene-1,2-epoxide hydrolase